MSELKKTNFFIPFKSFLLSLSLLLFFTSNSFCQTPHKIKTIIIDPGHGGEDHGAKGEYEGTLGSYEKNITLAISMKLVADLKKAMPDVNIIPTRTTDVFMNVHEKAQFANDHHGDLFVCIHADAVTLKDSFKNRWLQNPGLSHFSLCWQRQIQEKGLHKAYTPRSDKTLL